MIKLKKKVNLDTTDETKSFQERIDEVRSLVEENLRYTKAMRGSAGGREMESQKELQKLLQENLKISKQLYQMTKKINRWIVWQRVWGVVKILIIVVPIVLGIIYLPPLVKQLVEPLENTYNQVLNLGQTANQGQGLIDQFTGQLKGN